MICERQDCGSKATKVVAIGGVDHVFCGDHATIKPEPEPLLPICEAPGCHAEATRLIDGHHFCWRHRSHVAAIPLQLCQLSGCGSPVYAGGLCRHHFDRAPHRPAA